MGFLESTARFLATGSTTTAPPQNPRKVAKGTSYEAKGAIQPADTSGLESGSSTPSHIQELVPELASPFQRQQTYARMMNDAGTDVSVRAVKTPVLGAEFFMEPFSANPEDTLISEFIWDNLAGGMSAPFINSLEDILHFYEDGWSDLEKVYELREWTSAATGANAKNYTMLKKLGVRPVATVKEIHYDDNGGPVEIVQNAIRADNSVDEVTIPISKMLVFTFNRQGGDITGKSILRTAFPHWYYKTHFYKIDAIQKERHSLGVPKGKLMPGHNAKDKALLRTMLRNLRSNEESFMVLPPNVDVEFAEVHGNLVDVLKSAEHHNTMILLNVMAQFLALGATTEGGGRATASSQTDIFIKSLRHVANYIADVINMYLIPELVVYNFKTTNFPKLRVRNIGETRDLQMFASAISNVIAQGGIEMDEPTEAWLRRVFDMPMKDPSTTRVAPNQQQAQDSTQNGNGNGTTTTSGNQKGADKSNANRKGNLGKPANAPQ